ncbi:tetratricopeptide repeat protein [Alkalicoccus chagannorensis]|uniref:tetratricopeptide repeat protein n=1 Tax=Alkalicoccus chagannorensis TaxID=427072 RepID=UPI00041E9C6C|nr:SEC-C metal-binding domain-containing protein [Alkalicoccus chagannorensis]
MNVGRNDKCPCGSGKKYKKCCGQSNVTAFSQNVVKQEVDQAFGRLMDEGISNNQKVKRLIAQEGDSDKTMVRLELEVIGSMLLDPVKGNAEMKDFVSREKKQQIRPQVKAALEQWTNTEPGLFEITKPSIETGFPWEARNLYTGETFPVRAAEEDQAGEWEDMTFYQFGFPLSYGTSYMIHPPDLALTERGRDHFIQKVDERKVPADVTFHEDFFSWINVYERLFLEGDTLEQEEYFDPIPLPPEDKGVWDMVETSLLQEGAGSEVLANLKFLWERYLLEQKPRIPKPEVPAAALEYFFRHHDAFGWNGRPMTQKEAAQKYGVSPGSVSNRAMALESQLFSIFFDAWETEDQMGEPALRESDNLLRWTNSSVEIEMEKRLYQIVVLMTREGLPDTDATFNDLYHRLDALFEAKTAAEKAQMMVYDGYEQDNPEERIRTAENAMKIDPSCGDAYTLRATAYEPGETKLNDLLKAVNMHLRSGILLRVEEVEEAWHDPISRPYLRAEYLLAETYAALGDVEQAAKELEELLQHTPEDIQGARYLLGACYARLGRAEDLDHLLESFETSGSDDTWFDYTLLLHQVMTSTKSPGQEEKMMIQFSMMDAVESNPHIAKMLASGDIDQQAPTYHQAGSYEEAQWYLSLYRQAWAPYQQLLHELYEGLSDLP